MTYGVVQNGVFQPRNLIRITAKGFRRPMWGREGTYDQYVMKEIHRSYGSLEVKGQHVLDVGANIGCFTVWALEHGAKGVTALEPELRNFEMLLLNTGKRAYALNRALVAPDNTQATLWLSKTGKNPGNSSLFRRRGRQGITVAAVNPEKLRSLVTEDFTVVKMDCEGAEYEIMSPLLDACPGIRQVAMELHLQGFGLEQAQDLNSMMLDRGFKAKIPPVIKAGRWQTLAMYER